MAQDCELNGSRLWAHGATRLLCVRAVQAQTSARIATMRCWLPWCLHFSFKVLLVYFGSTHSMHLVLVGRWPGFPPQFFWWVLSHMISEWRGRAGASFPWSTRSPLVDAGRGGSQNTKLCQKVEGIFLEFRMTISRCLTESLDSVVA